MHNTCIAQTLILSIGLNPKLFHTKFEYIFNAHEFVLCCREVMKMQERKNEGRSKREDGKHGSDLEQKDVQKLETMT